MRLIYLFLLSCLLSITTSGQAKLNMELLAHVDFNEGGSGCWGHTDSKGLEYAIIGTRASIKILSLEDPTNPIERLSIPGNNTIWREARAYGNYIYVTTESQDGVTIIDISEGPDKFTWKRWKPAVGDNGDTLRTVHSINLDDKGYLYLNGHNIGSGGVLIYDLNQNGYEPTFMSLMGTVYTHDCYAVNDILYTADLSQGVGVYNISDRKNPVLINRFQTSTQFTHNMWTSPDTKYLYTTDERSGAYVDVYDVSDPRQVQFINKYRNNDSKLGSVIPHNVYAVGDFAVTSWYTDGVLIKDMSRPDNIIKVGEFDTYQNEASLPQNGTWFEGCWGVYPFLKSGVIVASDINTGLWLFKPTYQKACYLEGKVLVTDGQGSKQALIGAKVTIAATRAAYDEADQNGIYKTGIAESGTYKVYVEHGIFGRDSALIELKNGEVVNYDFLLTGKPLTIQVTDSDGIAIPNAKVNIEQTSNSASIEYPADVNGKIVALVNKDANYLAQIASWSYKGKEIQIGQNDNNIAVVLEKGYEDDFFSDLNWVVTKKAAAGNWERVIPKGTKLENTDANPSVDVSDDIGKFAFVTGNGGNAVSENDVDNGVTEIESPAMDYTNRDTAIIQLNKWFFNGGGSSVPNDEMTIQLTNGDKTILLDKINASTSGWEEINFKISQNEISFNDKMKLIVSVRDMSPGHIVEGAIDALKVELYNSIVATDDQSITKIHIVPNPVFNEAILKTNNHVSRVDIYNMHGVIVYTGNDSKLNVNALSSGVYYGLVIMENGEKSSFKFIKK